MNLRQEARAWIQRALVAAFPEQAADSPQTLDEYGDGLFAIAEQHDIPDESLVFWLKDSPRGKDWSLAAWRAWCGKYADARAKLPPGVGGLHSASELDICPRCYSSVLQPVSETRAWCQHCGEVGLARYG